MQMKVYPWRMCGPQCSSSHSLLRRASWPRRVRVSSSLVPFARYRSGCSTYMIVKRSSLSTSNNRAIQDYIRCQLRWMVHHAMRRGTSIARGMYGLAFGSILFIEMLFIAFTYCCSLMFEAIARFGEEAGPSNLPAGGY